MRGEGFIFIVVCWAILAFIPWIVAKNKEKIEPGSLTETADRIGIFLKWYIGGFLCWPIALTFAIVKKDKNKEQ